MADHLHDGASAIIGDHDHVWSDDPWTAWTGIVHGLAELGIGALAPSASEFAAEEDRVNAFVQMARQRDMQRVEQLLSRAAAHRYAPADLDPFHFIAGIVIVSRPLPDVTAQLLPDLREWIVAVYIDGLQARART